MGPRNNLCSLSILNDVLTQPNETVHSLSPSPISTFLCFFSFFHFLSSFWTMTDITDDIAEEISFQSFDDDCRLLGNLLNDILQREVGTNLVDKLERIRVLAQVKPIKKHKLFSLCFIPHFFVSLRDSAPFASSFTIHFSHVIFGVFTLMGCCLFIFWV